jgi:hypothetical protein
VIETAEQVHRFTAVRRFGQFYEFFCTCGWLTHAATAEDGFAYLERHAGQLQRF